MRKIPSRYPQPADRFSVARDWQAHVHIDVLPVGKARLQNDSILISRLEKQTASYIQLLSRP